MNVFNRQPIPSFEGPLFDGSARVRDLLASSERIQKDFMQYPPHFRIVKFDARYPTSDDFDGLPFNESLSATDHELIPSGTALSTLQIVDCRWIISLARR
jgi:hypothetical protein